MYNLLSRMCIKNQFIFLTIIVLGLKNPGKHLDVFLMPLIDKLKILWSIEGDTFGAFRKQNFQMRVTLI